MMNTPIVSRMYDARPKGNAPSNMNYLRVDVFAPEPVQNATEGVTKWSCRYALSGVVEFADDAQGEDSFEALEHAIVAIGGFLIGQNLMYSLTPNPALSPAKHNHLTVVGAFIDKEMRLMRKTLAP
jgi:hypothetical protein